jgi:hypothetical protein
MAQQNLRAQSLEYLIERITGLAAMATPGDVKAIMAVVARCTIEVSDSLRETAHTLDRSVERLTTASEAAVENLSVVSGEVRGATKQIETTAGEIHEFNTSTTVLTNEIIKLNRRLFWATVVIAIATAVGAIAGIFALFKRS